MEEWQKKKKKEKWLVNDGEVSCLEPIRTLYLRLLWFQLVVF